MGLILTISLLATVGWLIVRAAAKEKPNAIEIRRRRQSFTKEKYRTRYSSGDIPVIEETVIGEDEYFEFANRKTWGQNQAELLPETLVDGKQTWEVISGQEKHDLSKMLECCLAELERMRGTGQVPAPAYFERVAILMRKEKNYEKEIEIIEFYWRSLDEIWQKNQKISSSYIESLKDRFRHRHEKAKILLQKQKNSAK